MTDALLEVVRRGVRAYDLGRPMFVGMPQSPNHPAFWHTLPRRHGPGGAATPRTIRIPRGGFASVTIRVDVGIR